LLGTALAEVVRSVKSRWEPVSKKPSFLFPAQLQRFILPLFGGISGLKTVTSIILGVAALYLVFGALLFLFQRSLMFFPDQSRPEPADAGLRGVETVSIPTEDGYELFAWCRPDG
jgi:hypothetical protein